MVNVVIRSRLHWLVVLAVMGGISAPAGADDPPELFPDQLDDFIWTGAADGTTWENPGNWTPPEGFAGEYPDDPNRLDNDGDDNNNADLIDLVPVEGANFSVPLAGDLTVNIANGNVTVAAVKLGGTASAVTTNIMSSGGHRLVMENAERNNTAVMPTEWSYNQGAALIWSTGTPGAGKENRISADLLLNDNVDVEGDRDLHIYGNIYEGVIDRNPGDGIAESLPSSINNLLMNGKTVFIHGNINLVDAAAGGSPDDRPFFINQARGFPNPIPDPEPDPLVPRWSTVDVRGNIVGSGDLFISTFDGSNGGAVPVSNVILRGNNSGYTGGTTVGRVNLVLGHDNALGTGEVKTGNPNQGFGFNFISTANDRNIANEIEIAQWHTVRGAEGIAGLEEFSNSSITFSGEVRQSNTRGWINLLPYDFVSNTGPTLTLSGPQYPNTETEQPPLPPNGRFYTIDGSGKTIITGGIYNTFNNDPLTTTWEAHGNLRIRGTGAVYIDWVSRGMIPNPEYDAEDNPGAPQMIPDRPTDYTGFTRVEGANLHFAETEDLPGVPVTAEPVGEIISSGGAVGVDAGVVNNPTFLKMLNNAANPNASGDVLGNIFRTYRNEPIWETYDYGGLMLGTNEYNQNLDFSVPHSAAGNLARAANMSLAAHEGGSVYTGTITPAGTYTGFNALGTPNSGASGNPVNPNTYQLGGGSGTLQLPNQNQLTGARNLLVKNGGTVWLSNTNNYTGTTRVVGFVTATVEPLARADQSGVEGEATDDDVFDEGGSYRRSILQVSHLGNGGSPSSIGSSSSAAENLVIQGSTLRYVGAGQTTDRLFTIGTRGATLDASSASGALVFNNTGALGVDYAETRAGLLKSNIPGDDNMEIVGMPILSNNPMSPGGKGQHLFSTEDLLPGIRVTEQMEGGTHVLVDDDSPIVITAISSPHVVQIGETDTEADLENDATDQAAPFVWSGFPSGIVLSRFFQFGPSPARMLTLTGSNSMNNTLAPLIGNEPTAGQPGGPALAATQAEIDAGYGTVGVRKQGTGKWILTANNTYSGPTNVEQGTLLINGMHTGGGAYNVTGGVSATATVDAVLGGNGTITTSMLTVSGTSTRKGTISPGTSVGVFSVVGDVTFGENSNLLIELSGTNSDRLDITGNLDLSALLNSVTVTGSGTGGNWLIATYTGELTGVFDSVTPGYSLNYDTMGEIRLLAAAGLPGDYNGDGRVDGGDYVRWRNNLGDPTEADINNNGDGGGVGISDYAFWKARYGNPGSGGGGLVGGGQVPEPAGLVLVALALAWFGGLRRRG